MLLDRSSNYHLERSMQRHWNRIREMLVVVLVTERRL
jgi:hypothetical protein